MEGYETNKTKFVNGVQIQMVNETVNDAINYLHFDNGIIVIIAVVIFYIYLFVRPFTFVYLDSIGRKIVKID